MLWDELEQVHAQLGLAPPTATLTIEDLEDEGERLCVPRAAAYDVAGGYRSSAVVQELFALRASGIAIAALHPYGQQADGGRRR